MNHSKILEIVLLFSAIAIAVLTLGRFVFWTFPIELLTHFQMHYFWMTFILVLVFIVSWQRQQIKARITLFVLLFALIVNGSELVTWYLPNNQVSTDNTNILKVMSFNVNYQNLDANRIIGGITSVNPDLALIVEIEQDMMNKIIDRTIDTYPYHFRSLGGGLGVFSKLPLEDSSSEKYMGSEDTNLVTHIKYRNKRIQIIGVHLFVPVKADRFARRNRQLKALADHLEYQTQPTILMGDFNLTPWSPYYHEFIDKTDLHDTRYGFGILPTWIRSSTTVNLPKILIPLLNIPIDRILIDKNFKVVNTYTASDNGNSDHTAIISELVVQ